MNKLRKKIVGAVLAAAMAMAIPFTAGAAEISDFEDVKTSAWYYNAVEYAVSEGLFAGTGKTTFSPDGPMTRGMFVTVLGRKAGVDKSQYLTCRFNDVKAGAFYAPYAEWAAAYGIVSGVSETRFSPNDKITREQMASILYRYAKATENDATFSAEAYNSFSDTGKVSGWAAEAFQWAADKGIINGSDGKLNPKNTASRAQVAQIFYAGKDILIKTEVTTEPILPGSSDPKAHPDNVYNVFAREFSAGNDWKVSSKSRMASSEQEQLISLLKGKTGDCVWNEIALKGYDVSLVGETRVEIVHGENGDYTTRDTPIEKVAQYISEDLADHSFKKGYFCITLGDYVTSSGNVQNKDIFYELYFISTPDAHVNSSDSVFRASVKQKVVERLPSTFIWSEYALGGGWSCVPLLNPYHTTEEEQAEDYANFFVYMLTEGWGERSGAHYYIAFPPISETDNNGFENLAVFYG